MKKEQLLELGITEEAAEKVLRLADAELAAEKTKLTDKDAELKMAADKITELTEAVKKFDGEDIEKLKADLAAANKKYAEDTAALKLDNALTAALAGSGAKDADIVKRLIDPGIIKMDGDKLIGFTEQLEKLKADKSFLFDSADNSTVTSARIDTALDHGTATDTISDAQARAVMGLATN